MSLRLESRGDRVAVVEQRVRIVPTYNAGGQPVELLGLDNAQEGDRRAILLGKVGLEEPLPAHYLRRQARQDVGQRSEEHTSELQSRLHLVCRLLLEKKKET